MSKFKDMLEEMKTKDFSSLSKEEKREFLLSLQEAHVSHLMQELREGNIVERKIEDELK